MMHSENNELSSSHLLFHMIGYGLLLFVFLDIIDVIIPPQLMNPIWEFQTLGQVVERVPLPLLGLVLVFYGEDIYRSKWEKVVLKFLSHASILVGILFLLLIPLCISDAIRINNLNNERINQQFEQQISQMQKFEQQVNKASDQELAAILARMNSQSNSSEVKNSQELKNRLLTEVQKSQSDLKSQVQATRKDKGLGLLKNSVKWCIGALIAGDLFIRIWQATRWARSGKKRKLAS